MLCFPVQWLPLLCASLQCVRLVQCVRPFSWWGGTGTWTQVLLVVIRLTLCFIYVAGLNISGVLVAAPGFWGCSFPVVPQRTFFWHFAEISWPKERGSARGPDPDGSWVCAWGSLPWIISTGNLYPGSWGLKTVFPLHLFTYLVECVCMCLHAHVHMRAHMHVNVCACMYMCEHIYMCMCAHMYICEIMHVNVCMCVHACTCVGIYVCECMCMHMYMCKHICMWMCVCACIHM